MLLTMLQPEAQQATAAAKAVRHPRLCRSKNVGGDRADHDRHNRY